MKKTKIIKLFFTITASALTALTIINRIFYHLSTFKHTSDQICGEYYSWKFGKIFFRKEGQGSPILLIHTLDACISGIEWDSLLSVLKKNHTVYIPDLLGCGKSDKPQITYTNYLYVQLISDFIKDIIGQNTDIVASGNSSSLAIMTCHLHPDQLKKIILINPESFDQIKMSPTKFSRLIRRLIELPIIGTFLYNWEYKREKIRQKLNANLVSAIFDKKLLDQYEENAHLNISGGKCLMASLAGHYINIDITNALHTTKKKILIAVGKENPAKKTILSTYCKINPSVNVCRIPCSKSYPQLENADVLAKKINLL